MYLSNRFATITPSGTLKFTILIQELRAAGRDVIDLAVGEPDFAVDADVATATSKALIRWTHALWSRSRSPFIEGETGG